MKNLMIGLIGLMAGLSGSFAMANEGYQCEVSASKNGTTVCEGTVSLADPDLAFIGSSAWLPCQRRYNSSQLVMIQNQSGYTVVLKISKNENRNIGQSQVSFSGDQPRSFTVQFETAVDSVLVSCDKISG